MQNKLQIAVVNLANGGGLIHFDYQLCTALTNAGMDVTLITGTEYELSDQPHNFTVNRMLHLWKNFDPQPVQIWQLKSWKRWVKKIFLTLRRIVRAVLILLAWIRVARYLIHTKPDIVQFSKIEYSLDAIFIAYLGRRGLVLSQICHEFESRESYGRSSRLFQRLDSNAYAQFSAIFFLAKESQSRFLSVYTKIPELITHVIPHGNSSWLLNIPSQPNIINNIRARYGLGEGEQAILFFGLLSPSKGLDDLIDAFALVRQACNVKLIIAGFPMKQIDINALKSRIAGLDLELSTILDARYIPLEEIGAIMSVSTVVVYPYRSSTQSGALQTAYTFGRPVIATNVGGLPEAVDDGKSGFLVPAQSPRELADKIVILINNPGLAAQMGNYARHLSQTRFSWESVARHIAPVYEHLLYSGF